MENGFKTEDQIENKGPSSHNKLSSQYHPCLCCLFIQEVIREVDVRTVFENNGDLNRAENMNNLWQM